MTQTQNKIVLLTMKLDLKAREYKELCKELEEVKKKEQVTNEELLELKDKFQKNHDEIVEINNKLKKLKEKDNESEYKSFRQENLFNRNKEYKVNKEDNKELVVEKEKNIITKLIEKLKLLLKNLKRILNNIKGDRVMKKVNKETNKKGKVLAIVSLILGLVSIEYIIMGFFLEILSSIIYIPIICSILAIILGILSFKSGQKTLAIVGIVIGVLSITFFIFFYIMYNRAEYPIYIQESKLKLNQI